MLYDRRSDEVGCFGMKNREGGEQGSLVRKVSVDGGRKKKRGKDLCGSKSGPVHKAGSARVIGPGNVDD